VHYDQLAHAQHDVLDDVLATNRSGHHHHVAPTRPMTGILGAQLRQVGGRSSWAGVQWLIPQAFHRWHPVSFAHGAL